MCSSANIILNIKLVHFSGPDLNLELCPPTGRRLLMNKQLQLCDKELDKIVVDPETLSQVFYSGQSPKYLCQRGVPCYRTPHLPQF